MSRMGPGGRSAPLPPAEATAPDPVPALLLEAGTCLLHFPGLPEEECEAAERPPPPAPYQLQRWDPAQELWTPIASEPLAEDPSSFVRCRGCIRM